MSARSRVSTRVSESTTPVLVKTAKLFMNGGSQAVRLPKEFAFEGTEILVMREGDSVVLKAKPSKAKTLGELLDGIWAKSPTSSTLERPPQPPMPPTMTW